MLDTTVRVLLEEDPEGMLQAGMSKWLKIKDASDVGNWQNRLTTWPGWLNDNIESHLIFYLPYQVLKDFVHQPYFLDIPGLCYIFHLKGELEWIFQWYMFVVN